MKKHLLILACIAFAGRTAMACECMESSDSRKLDRAGLAFIGIAAPLGAAPEGGAMTAFTIKAVFKGRAETSVVIHHHEEGTACGVIFEPGELYTVLASRGNDGNWYTNSCLDVWGTSALQDYKDKVDALTAPILANPQDEEALLAKGRFLLDNGDDEGALALFNYLRGIAPGNADALIGRARAFMALESYKEAAADLENALMLSPDNTEALELKTMLPEE
ncbi:MAG TPA: hypothetical protein DCW68_03435 [Rhodospirillaceae bacterium]|nr:MAG: hypothetical protein A2018_06405 [Alphaproteobacteria bacterium GWF2_58_20]HAU29146.1 hypothetical protein [Rhodospirillaceae bacterium]